MIKQLSCGVAAALLSLNLNAAENPQSTKDSDEPSYALGLYAYSQSSPYIDGDTQSGVFPYIEFEWGPIFFQGGSLGTYLYGDDNWGIAAMISADFAGDTERGDSKKLKDMDDLDDVISGSLVVFYEADWGEVEVTLAQDISNKHDGSSADVTYSYPIKMGDWVITPSAGAQWLSDDVTQYYYGVKTHEARVGRNAYQPDSGVNYSIGLNAVYTFEKHHNVILDLSTEFYSSEIKDSPLIDRSSSTGVGVGYVYRF